MSECHELLRVVMLGFERFVRINAQYKLIISNLVTITLPLLKRLTIYIYNFAVHYFAALRSFISYMNKAYKSMCSVLLALGLALA
jgi:hypothetical protein